ncbi:YncE family protein [Candidatus Palauibacter sp.]|uniref:YncE family protein n=1 Tax=Candidatus Palauibacter sp. TaxID=3101350 RepID=UPI003B01FD89
MGTPRPGTGRRLAANFRALGAIVSLAAAGFACGAPAEDFDDAGGPFRVGDSIEVGAAPHGIRFSPDGDTAWVALSGEGRIAVVDLTASAIIDRWEAGTTPLDLIRVEGGWLVSQFRDSTLIMLDAEGRTVPDAVWGVGVGPSLFTPGTVRGESWITTEFSDRLWVVGTRQGAPRSFHATGDRPYPADVMWDGSYAFVPNLDAGTVSVIDLLNDETDAEVDVCPGPPGGALAPDQVTYIVACGGSDEVAFINTASFEIAGRVTDGLGPRPFSVVVPGEGRYALVNNAGGSTVSVVDLEAREVAQRIEVGEQPIVLRAHPDGERVFVANEISGTLVELVPTAPPAESPAASEVAPNEVVVLGMIHGGHETSEMFSLDVVRDLVREIDPDYWLTEIPPNRWDRAWAEFRAAGTVEEPRVRRFPEYMEGLFPLTRELDFEAIPTAGWTEPMSDFRAAYLDAYARDPARADRWAEYQTAAEASAEALAAGAADDPRWIHTDAYDEAYDIRMRAYARLFDADLGPGGWEAINASHWANIERALDGHRGEGVRFLLTYGAGHKGPFLRELRARNDIVLLEVAPFLDRLSAR